MRFKSVKWLAWDCPTNRCQSWNSNAIQLAPEPEFLELLCTAPCHLHLWPSALWQLKPESRASCCSTSAGNMYFGQLKFFTPLHMLHKLDLKAKNKIPREGYYIMIKWSIPQGDKSALNVHAVDNAAANYMKQKNNRTKRSRQVHNYI